MRTNTAAMRLEGHLHDNVFSQKLETYYAFFLFVFMTTAFWGLKNALFFFFFLKC